MSNKRYFKPKLYNDHFQNFKVYGIPKAQLIIADVPYNLGANAYASNPSWYINGDNKNGESELAGKQFFDTDKDFRPAEFMHFCAQMLRPEPKVGGVSEDENVETIGESKKRKSTSPCMIIFLPFEQWHYYIDLGKRYGFNHYIPLVFRKNFSAQVLKANMKVVGNCEYGLILYRDKLPKFNNKGQMIFNCMDWVRDSETKKVHPCLPAGQKVFVNNTWVNIESVNVGDYSSYGKIVETTCHDAEHLIEINAGTDTVIATHNHPFLILRGKEIAWCEAKFITNNDYILCRTGLRNNTNQLQKDILGSKEENTKWSTVLSGNNTTEQYRLGCKSITSTEIEQIIELRTYSLSLQLSTSGYTKVADLLTENGINHVRYVENISHAQKNTGTLAEGQSMEGYVRNATSQSLLKHVRLSLRKVGNVKNITERMKVYNLTIEGVPAFDTLVGVSHNTQKPIPLLKDLIRLFSDEGDVVIDPVAGSGSTLLAASELGRKSYGFEIKKDFFKLATEQVLSQVQLSLF